MATKQRGVIERALQKGREMLNPQAPTGSAATATAAEQLEKVARSVREAHATVEKHKPALERVRDVAEQLGKAWSGSFIGYHSRVYKSDLRPKGPGDYFDVSWGHRNYSDTHGQWSEFDFETLRNGVYDEAGVDFAAITAEIRPLGNAFDANKKQAEALLAALSRDDDYLKGIAQEIDKLSSHLDASGFVSLMMPSRQIRTADMRAVNEGIQTPPHLDAQARAFELLSYGQQCEKLASALDTAVTYLKARLPASGGQKVTDEEHAIARTLLVLERFHAVATQLRRRHAQRETLDVKDEYDVQDLLHALLKVDFADVRREEWTPSYAGKSTRADFLLKREGIFVEAKIARAGHADKEIGEELDIDFSHYREHPACKVLVCFVYDPGNVIANHRGLQDDLEKRSDERVRIIVRVHPNA